MTKYDILKLYEGPIRIMLECGLNIKDIEHLALYEQYCGMKKKKHKVSYIVNYLGEKYGLTERAVYKIVDRMEKRVKPLSK